MTTEPSKKVWSVLTAHPQAAGYFAAVQAQHPEANPDLVALCSVDGQVIEAKVFPDAETLTAFMSSTAANSKPLGAPLLEIVGKSSQGGVGGSANSPQESGGDGPPVSGRSPAKRPHRDRTVSARLAEHIKESLTAYPVITLARLHRELGIPVTPDGLRHAVRIMRDRGDVATWREPRFSGELWVSDAGIVDWLRGQRNGDAGWSTVIERVFPGQFDQSEHVALVKILEAAGVEMEEQEVAQ